MPARLPRVPGTVRADAVMVRQLHPGGIWNQKRPAFERWPLFLCAEHVRQLRGESPFDKLMEVRS
jgi:hypothetical protein